MTTETLTLELPPPKVPGEKRQKTYRGRRYPDYSVGVLVDVRTPLLKITYGLPKRHDLRDHSDDFEWGYAGSGPSQLALAILADFLDDDCRALRLYRQFKEDYVKRWPRSSMRLPSVQWRLPEFQLEEWLATVTPEE